MALRIACGRWWQETNDLNPVATTRRNFETYAPILKTSEDFEALQGARAGELGGFVDELNWHPCSRGGVDELSAWGDTEAEIIPLCGMTAFSSGRMEAAAYAAMREEILAPLRAAQAVAPLDGVLVTLHGAMVAHGQDDPEGALLADMREIVGADVPIVCTLDLHCHVTRTMVDAATALVLYLTAPHIDMYETGQRGARALKRLLGGEKVATAFCKFPSIMPAERANTQATAQQQLDGAASAQRVAAYHKLLKLEQLPWVLSAGVSTTQPWLAVSEMGSSVIITAAADHAAEAAAAAAALAEEFWEAREEYMPTDASCGGGLLPAAAAVEQAHAYCHGTPAPSGSCVIGDGSDATTSGAPGDATGLLRELISRSWASGPALIPMISPQGVAACEACGGAGEEITLSLGGVLDTRFSAPLQLTGTVGKLWDCSYKVARGHCAGMAFNLGRAATLRTEQNVVIILVSVSGGLFCCELFEQAGFDPFSAGSAIIAKSPAGFRATYDDESHSKQAGLLLSSEQPGCAPPRYWLPEYERYFSDSARSCWPWQRDLEKGDTKEWLYVKT